MTLDDVKKIYETWFREDDASDQLQDWLDSTIDCPDKESIVQFAVYIVQDFHYTKGPLWIRWAIGYLGYGKPTPLKIHSLESVISNYDKYKFSGARESASSLLGSIAPYPNQVLKEAITTVLPVEPDTDPEYYQLVTRQFQSAAFGGYIMTATDFQTGMDAGRAIKASGETPTVEKAEQIIAEWRKEHGSSSP